MKFNYDKANYQRTLEWLTRWGLKTTAGCDDGGDYLEFDAPEDSCRKFLQEYAKRAPLEWMLSIPCDFFPDLYTPPSRMQRSNLDPGDFAKLIFIACAEGDFDSDGPAESMWVKVTGKKDEWYRGVLDDAPLLLPRSCLKAGDGVEFMADDVAGIIFLTTEHPVPRSLLKRAAPSKS